MVTADLAAALDCDLDLARERRIAIDQACAVVVEITAAEVTPRRKSTANRRAAAGAAATEPRS
jgi:hypothetical protein